ncbi:MAG: protein-(glutamine-N5) methyltransferase, release factor-specific [Rhizobiales bacterium PAR1]|nr:MAG: protein-(glutamine-N5) methyltransferase, release factor-specific [Rhizobiales bacterium PAR1]
MASGTSKGLTPEMTLAAAHSHVAERLLTADIDESRLEARLLLMAALEMDHAALILRERTALGHAASRLEAFLSRRLAHEPISRILGRREFYGLSFSLNPETLDPRPDTETLVDAVLAHLATERQSSVPLKLLDIGTGTGAILLALLSRLPLARGVGVDIAPAAVEAARANAEALELSARAEFRTGDLLEDVEAGFDVLVSNPPYVPTRDLAGLDPEVRLFDPARALDGGVDGLIFYRHVIGQAAHHVRAGGLIAFEVGAGQARDVESLMEKAGIQSIRTRFDLGGIERVVMGILPPH